MKIFLALVLLAASSLARPEIGIERKFEISRDINAQQLAPLADSANLPIQRTNKERQIYLEEAQIPVHLIYETDQDETEAIVKEISLESMHKKQGKILNRVERSDSKSNLLGKSLLINEIGENNQIFETEKHQLISKVDGINEKYFPVNKRIKKEHEEQYDNKELKKRFSPLNYNFNYNKIIGANRKLPNILEGIRMYSSLSRSIQDKNYNPKQMSSDSKIKAHTPFIFPSFVSSPLQGKENYKNIIYYDLPIVAKNHPYILEKKIICNSQTERCSVENKMKNRIKRELIDDDIIIPQSLIDDLSRQHSFGLIRPNIMKLKVRRGGIAIAGPGGIATAGSGGTTIVGPGGTAFTPPDTTAVVGPGGRVVHIPGFDLNDLQSKTVDISKLLKNAKVVAHGPIVYYNPPSNVEHL